MFFKTRLRVKWGNKRTKINKRGYLKKSPKHITIFLDQTHRNFFKLQTYYAKLPKHPLRFLQILPNGKPPPSRSVPERKRVQANNKRSIIYIVFFAANLYHNISWRKMYWTRSAKYIYVYKDGGFTHHLCRFGYDKFYRTQATAEDASFYFFQYHGWASRIDEVTTTITGLRRNKKQQKILWLLL